MKDQGITTITLKKINRGKVYRYIYEKRLTSKLQIVQDLQMGLSTVSQNLNALEQDGLIERNGFFDSTGGRKAQAIQIVSDTKLSIGVGILKQMFHIVALNLYGEAIAKDTLPIPYSSSDAYYDRIAEEIGRFIERNGYPTEKILGVSIATQGIISTDGSTVTYGAIMNNAQMKLSDFSSRLPYPCHLEHDSKAAACLELWNHSDFDSAVLLLLNRNFGGAIITNHQVHQGIHMRSGTIEHMCINPSGPFCYCGNRGCLETYCSATALEAAAGISIKEFFSSLRQGTNSFLTQLWNDYLEHLAFAIRNLNLIIDSPVILSGYLAPYFVEEDIEYLLKCINTSSPFPLSRDQFVLGTHGQYTPAIGAALFYIEQLLASIEA